MKNIAIDKNVVKQPYWLVKPNMLLIWKAKVGTLIKYSKFYSVIDVFQSGNHFFVIFFV